MSRLIADTYDRVIIALLVIQYVFVNLVFTTYTQNIVMMKDLSAPFFSILILGIWVLGDLSKYGRWELPKNGIVPATVGALLFWLISVYVGTSPAYGVELWGRMFGYFIQVWAVVRFLDSYDRVRLFLRTIVVTNALIVFYGLTQLVDNDILVALGVIPDWGSHVFVSTHGNPNFLAGDLITSFPAIVGYWFLTRNPFMIVTLPILVILNLYEVVESTARGAYIAVALYIPVLLLGLWINRHNLSFFRDDIWRAFLKAVAILLVVAILAGGIFAYEKMEDFSVKLYQQFYTLVDFEGNYTNWVRLVFFQMALDGGVRYPWMGRGMASFNWHMPETRPVWYHRTGVSHNTDHPHNEHLEWLHDTGMPGLAFFWWVVVTYFVTGLREIRRHRTGAYYPFLLSAWMGPFNQWIQGTFDVETRWTGNGVTMWFMVGFVLGFCNLPVKKTAENIEITVLAKPVDEKGRSRRAARASHIAAPVYVVSPYLPHVAIAFALVVAFYMAKSRDFWLADHHLRNNMAYTDGGAGSNAQAIKEAEAARELSYATTSNYYKLAYTYLVANKLPQAMNAYRDLQAFAPNYAQIHINLAFLNDQLGYRTASAWERDRASMIEHNTRNHRDAANYWLQLGYPLRAVPHLRMCFTIERERTEAGYYYWYEIDNIAADLARVYASSGRMDLAKVELTRALQFNPNNLSAALLLTELLQQAGHSGGSDELQAMLQKHAPDNPALLVLKMQTALGEKNYAAVLELADRASSVLGVPGPGAQASQESQMLGNSILQAVQTVFAADFNRASCLEIAGWVYACQGRYNEAAPFLEQAFMASKSPRTAERLGLVKARLAPPSA
jgi:tetratricopeptide (TPR) repeat protein